MISVECPSREELSKYTLGTLREESVPGLERHLDACPVCTETIQLLESQTDSFTGMLKHRQVPQDVNLLSEEPFLSAVASLARMTIADSFVGSGIQPHLRISSTSHPVPQPGQQLGQYTLLEVVGKGGMGLVYRARQEKLNKIVALKLLSAARVHDPRMQVRFHREMQAAGTIDHSNVVRALDADEVDGVHFLVMEFVDGVDLSAMLKQLGPLSVQHACSMIRMAAVGLSRIHHGRNGAQGCEARQSAPSGTRLWQIQQTDNAQPKERAYLSNLDVPLAGDWDRDGDDDLGGWRPEPNQKPCFWQFETSGDSDSECDLEGLGVETDIPFVLRHNEKRATAQ